VSSHQIEGGLINNWSRWEIENAGKLAKDARNSPWPREGVLKKEARNPPNYISGLACDHYNLFKSDFNIAEKLGFNAFRFSIDWSRIEPEEGKFDQKGLDFYLRYVKELIAREIEPFVTLWHWPIPLWLEKKGGLESKDFTLYFVRYASKLARLFKNKVIYIQTVNEPEIFTSQSYLLGRWPPGRKNPFSYLKVLKVLSETHKKSYLAVKKVSKKFQVGIAKNNAYFEAYKNRPQNKFLKLFAKWWWNDYFLNSIKDYQDFIGLNHYFHYRIDDGVISPGEKRVHSDIGWELYPSSIYFVLKDLLKYKKPVFITENGLADYKDKYRGWYIKEILKNVYRAVSEGVDVKGYFHWSLLDNFEWAEGFWPRFGLVEVDYGTQKRKIRKSAFEYSRVIRNNGLDD